MSIRDLGPPAPDRTVAYGRCHQPGRPVGYWSLYEDTALAEVRAELNEQYAISTFTVPEGSLFVPVGNLDYYRRTGRTYLGHEVGRSGENYRKILDREDWGIFALFDAFLADEFIKSAVTQSDYRITSAIADILFNCNLKFPEKIDGIVYPGVAFREGANFAVRADVFRSKMRPDLAKTRIVEVTDVLGYGIFAWKELAVLESVNSDDTLCWKELP